MDITAYQTTITKASRQELNCHKSAVIWLTGLSGSGKSTIANALDEKFYERLIRSYVLGGDIIRQGLCKDLGFSHSDRSENIRRVAETAKLFIDAGLIAIVAVISPFQEDRAVARQLFEPEEFIEVYVKCPLETCESRDPKGLYKKARLGKLSGFTGIDSPYEAPVNPDIIIETDKITVEEACWQIIQHLESRQLLSKENDDE